MPHTLGIPRTHASEAAPAEGGWRRAAGEHRSLPWRAEAAGTESPPGRILRPRIVGKSFLCSFFCSSPKQVLVSTHRQGIHVAGTNRLPVTFLSQIRIYFFLK